MTSASVEGDAATQSYTACVAQCGERSVDVYVSLWMVVEAQETVIEAAIITRCSGWMRLPSGKTDDLTGAPIVCVERNDYGRNFALHGQGK
jgi:hypothetical protein